MDLISGPAVGIRVKLGPVSADSNKVCSDH